MTQVYFTPHEREMAVFYAGRGKPFDSGALAAAARDGCDEDAAEIADLEQDNERLEREVDSLESQVGELEEEKQELEAKVVTLKKQVDLFGNIVDLAKQITEIKQAA